MSPLLRPAQVGNFEKFLKTPGLVKFCFVRNPYERVLSAYLNKVRALENIKGKEAGLARQLGLDQSRIQNGISFETFVFNIDQVPIERMNSHWRPQYFQTFQETVDFDLIGRLEEFINEIHKLETMMAIPLTPFLGSWDVHRTDSRRRLSDYYTPELQERVYRIYEVDFKNFGYSADLPEPKL